jgi:Cyclic nucleotide-binding domain
MLSRTMLRPGIHLAESDAEKEAVYRLRYDIYVEEMGRFRGLADHAGRRLIEPEDATARIFYGAEADGTVVATLRLSWGGDAPFSKRLIESYQLAPFLAEMAPERIAVGERGMVTPRLRGSEIYRELGLFSRRFTSEKRIELIFGACEPHLLSLYVGQGARTFSNKNINSPEVGFAIPIVTVVEDVAYLRRIGSPSAATAKDWGDQARIPACVDRLITNGGNVISQRLTAAGAFWGEIHDALEQLGERRVAPFDGLSEEQAQRCIGKSNIIDCTAGDRVLKKGNVARNMFVVLDGTLEVRDGETLLRVLSPGDVVGEIAFLLEQPRSADVYAATDARVLSLSEGTVRKLIESDPDVAAHLLLNVSKMLCRRILESG